jgi:hypothetical protein
MKKKKERETHAYLLGLVEVVPKVKGEEGAVLVITERKDMQCTLLVGKKKLQKLMNRYWSCDEQQKPRC